MKKFLIALLKAFLILAVAVGLAMLGIQLDQQLFAERPAEAMGHPMPVFTMILPMLWLGIIFWIAIIKTFVKILMALIRRLRKGKDK